jgi:hypothetical protein
MRNLEARRRMIVASLELLRNSDDPLREDAIAHYESQLKEIDIEIRQENSDLAERIEKPFESGIVINLKTGYINISGRKANNG